MSDGLSRLNAMGVGDARDAFMRCCGSRRWADLMAAARPFASRHVLFAAAERFWEEMGPADFLEAFSHHPKIGEKSLRDRWATGEQKGVQGASEETLQGLARGNADYEKKFGFIFLVCATGKSADEMLALLEARVGNDRDRELSVAAGEQAKITRIRLEKLLSGGAI